MVFLSCSLLPAYRYEECGLVFVFYLIHKAIVVTLNPDDVKVRLFEREDVFKCLLMKVILQEIMMKPKYKKSDFVYEKIINLLGERLLLTKIDVV